MKVLSVFGIMLLALAACGDPSSNASEAKEVKDETGTELKFSNDGSTVSFHADKTVGSHDGGFNKFTGKVIVDGDTVKRVAVDFDMTGIWTDDDKSDEPKLTNHLKSKDFFDVESHPTGKFVTTEIKPGAKGATHTVTGNLTLRGTTKSITFPADITISNGKVAAKAKFEIDRQDWGVSYQGVGDGFIHDDVELTLDINAG